MRIITVLVYGYDELSPEAQRRARDWYRENVCPGDDVPVMVAAEQAEETLRLFGVEVGRAPGSRKTPAIYWDDVTCAVEGDWDPARVSPSVLDEWRDSVEYGPLAEQFAALVASAPADVDRTASLSSPGRYLTQEVSFSYESDERPDLAEWYSEASGALYELVKQVGYAARREVEWHHSDECIGEELRHNGYRFLENGDRWNG